MPLPNKVVRDNSQICRDCTKHLHHQCTGIYMIDGLEYDCLCECNDVEEIQD